MSYILLFFNSLIKWEKKKKIHLNTLAAQILEKSITYPAGLVLSCGFIPSDVNVHMEPPA